MRTTEHELACAVFCMIVPKSRYNVPGFINLDASCKQLYDVSTNLRPSLSTLPTKNVSFRSPWNPRLLYVVTSIFTISPSSNSR